MDRVLLNGMKFFGYHGALPQETTLGQKFIIDLELYLSLKEAGSGDDLTKGVSYADVYSLVKKIVEGKPFKLIEALGDNITSEIFKEFSLVNRVVVTIKKPEAPVPGIFDYMGVVLDRERS